MPKRKSKNLYEIAVTYFIALILFVVFVETMFKLSPWSGIGFIISCGLAFYRGAVLKDPRLIGFIAVGNILTNVAMSQLLPQIWSDMVQGSFLTAGIVLAVFIIIVLRARQLADYPEKRGNCSDANSGAVRVRRFQSCQ